MVQEFFCDVNWLEVFTKSKQHSYPFGSIVSLMMGVSLGKRFCLANGMDVLAKHVGKLTGHGIGQLAVIKAGLTLSQQEQKQNV